MKKLKLIGLGLLIVVTLLMFTGCKDKKPNNPDPFVDNKIIIYVYEEFRNKHFTLDDFQDIGAKELVVYIYPTNTTVHIILAQRGLQHVLDTIEIVKTYGFGDVEPLYIAKNL